MIYFIDQYYNVKVYIPIQLYSIAPVKHLQATVLLHIIVFSVIPHTIARSFLQDYGFAKQTETRFLKDYTDHYWFVDVATRVEFRTLSAKTLLFNPCYSEKTQREIKM